MVYLIALGVPPILLVLTWWDWFHSRRTQTPKSERMSLLSGLYAATANFALQWGWVVWLRFHYGPPSWKVQDWISNLGLCLLLYAGVVAVDRKGRLHLLGIISILAMLPWIRIGIL